MKKFFLLSMTLMSIVFNAHSQTTSPDGIYVPDGVRTTPSILGRYYKAGAYLTMGHTSSVNGGNSPFISFNALLTKSTTISSVVVNEFTPAYSGVNASGLVIFGEAATSALHFKQMNYSSSSPININSFTEPFTLLSNGNIGINNSNPTEKLDVNGNIKIADNGLLYSFTNTRIQAGASGYIAFNSGGFERMRVSSNGTVGIGDWANSANFATSRTYKLVVDGVIGASEVNISLQRPWPDFVFNTDYELRSLYSVEEYIQKNKHLPEMPSAEEVKNGGVKLGEMNAKLLQKVEEITLYMIEMKKENDELKKEVNNLKIKYDAASTPQIAPSN